MIERFQILFLDDCGIRWDPCFCRVFRKYHVAEGIDRPHKAEIDILQRMAATRSAFFRWLRKLSRISKILPWNIWVAAFDQFSLKPVVEFSSSCFRKCDRTDLIDIDSCFDHGNHPADQHSCFSGSGTCFNEKVLVHFGNDPVSG